MPKQSTKTQKKQKKNLTEDEEEMKRFTDAVGKMKITFQDAHSLVKDITEFFTAKQNRRESS